MKYFVLILLLILTIGCKSKKEIITPNPIEEIKNPDTPQMIFINFMIRADETNKISAHLINKIIVDGTFKDKGNKNETFKSGDLVCNQLNQISKTIESQNIKNPLIKNVEYVNDNGEFERKEIKLDSAEISLRLQLNPDTKFISLDLIGMENTTLLNFEL